MNLYEYAEQNGIEIDYCDFKSAKAVCVPYSIGLNKKIETKSAENTILAHEIGHCMTNTFYNSDSLETRSRMEYRANKWAITHALPLESLSAAFEKGMRSIYELAEYFNVTEEFMLQAVNYYLNNANFAIKKSRSL